MNATLSPPSRMQRVVSSSSQSVSFTRTMMPGRTDVPWTNISSFSLKWFLLRSSINFSTVHEDFFSTPSLPISLSANSISIFFFPSKSVSRPPLYHQSLMLNLRYFSFSSHYWARVVSWWDPPYLNSTVTFMFCQYLLLICTTCPHCTSMVSCF